MEIGPNGKEQFLSSKRSKNTSPNKNNTKPIDQLNEWSYVNPVNKDDNLPQPYRAINKIIQEDILSGVYQQIFDIEKYKTDPNYEGHLKSLPPQGSFDISHITCVCKESQQAFHNHVIAGDAYGNIMILDLNKKMRVAKKEVGVGKRISKVAIGVRETSTDEQQTIQNVAVVAHLDPSVYIYRYRLGENKLFLHYTIQISKDDNSTKIQNIGELPVEISFSIYSQFLQVTQHNGNILIFKIPDVINPIKTEEDAIPKTGLGKQKIAVQINPIPQQPPKQSFFPDNKQQVHQTSLASYLEVKPTILSEVFYKVNFKGVKKEPKYLDIIQNLRQEYLKPLAEVQTNPIVQKDEKKKVVPPAKTDPKKVEEQVVVQVKADLDFESNFTTELIEHMKAEDGLDVSAELPQQKFKPFCHFVQESIGFGQNQKTFNLLKKYEIIVGLVVVWSNTSMFEIHNIQSPSKVNLPDYIQLKINHVQIIPDGAVQEKLIQIQNPPQLKFIPQVKQIKTIYPISVIAVSQSCAFLALGLQQGSIIIYDLSSTQEKFYLDKHQACVTHILFCDDWKLVSGAHDGTVHIYDLLEQGKLIMKRTNQFRKKKTQVEIVKGGAAIAYLGVSSSGVAIALDHQHEIRLYDVWHGEKIGKLNAQQVMDDKKRIWSLWPKPVLLCGKSEIIIIADIFDQGNTQDEIHEIKSKWTKNTCLQIFKIFDNLINLFPALSNVYRRGIDKEKVIHLYSKISGASLKNPSFEVPSLAGYNELPKDNKSLQNSRKSIHLKDQKTKQLSNQSKSPNDNTNKDFLHKIKEEDLTNIASLVISLHGSSISDSNQDFNSSFRSQATRLSHKEAKIQYHYKLYIYEKTLYLLSRCFTQNNFSWRKKKFLFQNLSTRLKKLLNIVGLEMLTEWFVLKK